MFFACQSTNLSTESANALKLEPNCSDNLLFRSLATSFKALENWTAAVSETFTANFLNSAFSVTNSSTMAVLGSICFVFSSIDCRTLSVSSSSILFQPKESQTLRKIENIKPTILVINASFKPLSNSDKLAVTLLTLEMSKP